MAKGNPFFGQLRGSIGDVVFTRTDGVQISKSRNRSPRNPQTDAQMVQRIILKTCSMAYSLLAVDYTDQTFQGASVGKENQRRFMSRNTRLLREGYDIWGDGSFATKNATTAMLNGYILSEGSLPDPYAKLIESGGDRFGYMENLLVSQEDAFTVTYQQVCDKLGLPAGSQLTFLFAYGTPGETIDYCRRARIILSPSTGDMNTPFFTGSSYVDLSINMPNVENDVDVISNIAIVPSNHTIMFEPEAQSNFTVVGFGVVASYKDGSTWRYSEGALNSVDNTMKNMQEAIESYLPSSNSESLEYTRQADSGATSSGISVTSMAGIVEGYGDGLAKVAARFEESGNEAEVTVNEWDASTRNYIGISLTMYGDGLENIDADNVELKVGGVTIAANEKLVVADRSDGSLAISYILPEGYPATNVTAVLTVAADNGVTVASVSFALPRLVEPAGSVTSATVQGGNAILTGTNLASLDGLSATVDGMTFVAVLDHNNNKLVVSYGAMSEDKNMAVSLGWLTINFAYSSSVTDSISVVSPTIIDWSVYWT